MSSRVQILLIEHDDVHRLYPFTEMHCSWELRVGRYTILERWQHVAYDCSVTVTSDRTEHVQSFVERHPQTSAFIALPTLAISGNVLLAPNVMRKLIEHCASSNVPVSIFCDGAPIGSFIPTAVGSPAELATALDHLDSAYPTHVTVQGHRIERLWHAIDHVSDAIVWDAALCSTLIDPTATVHSSAVLDDRQGPIIIGEYATIEPMAVVIGPAVIGPHAKIRPHAHIEHAVVGPGCKVGGEVEASVMHGWSNKQHLGFLGHSYVCEWVNLGAGCTTSDLKNTYGHVHVDMPWGREDTQRMFVGLLIGDHSKAAIGTQFLTGTVCGVSANVLAEGFPPRSIPSFTWIDTAYDVDKAIDVASIVMHRRAMHLGTATERLLRSCARATS